MSAPLPWFSPATIKLMKKYHSDAMNIKPLLLVVPRQPHAVIGWYFGGLINDWRMAGSPTPVEPKLWMPLPEAP